MGGYWPDLFYTIYYNMKSTKRKERFIKKYIVDNLLKIVL